jgi:hypothetical protein
MEINREKDMKAIWVPDTNRKRDGMAKQCAVKHDGKMIQVKPFTLRSLVVVADCQNNSLGHS